MRKIYLFIFAVAFSNVLFAQTAVNDSVSMSAGYSNDIFYNFYSGAKSNALTNEWDMAFSVNPMEVGIRINAVNGVNLWAVPGTDINGWNTVDSTGYLSWPELHNTDTAMYYGAFNIHATGSQFDFSWGVYDFNTHEVIGDSLFLIKVTDASNNVFFKKLWIIKRANNSTHDWIFRYANLDNSNDITVTIPTTVYSAKNFIYYSILNGTTLDREPASADWDILFTRYTTDVGGGFYYPVAGIYSNSGVEVADVRGVNVSTTNSDAPYLNLYSYNLTEIGYDWKTYNMTSAMWEVEDSMLYFVKTNAGEVYKLVMTGFEGATTGNIFFNKTLIYTTGINDFPHVISNATIYPNPAHDHVSVLFSSLQTGHVQYQVTDLQGKKIICNFMETHAGLNHLQFNCTDLAKGVYILELNAGNDIIRQKLIIQ